VDKLSSQARKSVHNGLRSVIRVYNTYGSDSGDVDAKVEDCFYASWPSGT
jgi:hypothetical protein